jgi:hypothetical protein
MPPADPAPAPEWAVNVALEEFDKDRIDLGFVDTLARLLATLRERTLREAAGVCGGFMDAMNAANVSGEMGKAKSFHKGQMAAACADAILSLIAQPPKDEGGAG